jgi:hypothetical protein
MILCEETTLANKPTKLIQTWGIFFFIAPIFQCYLGMVNRINRGGLHHMILEFLDGSTEIHLNLWKEFWGS